MNNPTLSKIQFNTGLRNPNPTITREFLENTISTDTLFRWLHIPFVMAEIVWDYIDTPNDIAKRLKLSEFKKTSRKIAELHLEYDRFRQPFIEGAHREAEKANSEALLDELDDDLNIIYQDIFNIVKQRYSELDEEMQIFVAATCEAYVVYKAILQYNADFRIFLKQTYGIDSNEVLTKHFVELIHCINDYLKDYKEMFNDTVVISSIIKVKNLISSIVLYDDDGEITPVYEPVENNNQN